jgi:hypothetical protein
MMKGKNLTRGKGLREGPIDLPLYSLGQGLQVRSGKPSRVRSSFKIRTSGIKGKIRKGKSLKSVSNENNLVLLRLIQLIQVDHH